MRYFAYMAERSFRTYPEGDILFFPQGLLSRPYLVPNVEEKQRLQAKLTWFYRFIFGGLFVALFLWGRFLTPPLVFFLALAGMLVLQYIVFRLIFRNDLRAMKRSESRTRLSRFYAGAAAQNSSLTLALGFAISLIISLINTAGLLMGISPPITAASELFFKLCTVAWGCALLIKMRTKA